MSTLNIFDSEDEDNFPACDDDRLDWRSEDSRIVSDWKIEVVRQEDNVSMVYDVHKTVLAFGKRKSEYFARQFKNPGRFSEDTTQTTRVVLPKLAADAIPQLLDYHYGGPEAFIEVDAESATALLVLADYFENDGMLSSLKEFWKKDLRMCNVHTY